MNDETKKWIRRHTIGPLKRRKLIADRKTVEKAIERLDVLAKHKKLLEKQKNNFSLGSQQWRNPRIAQEAVFFAQSLYHSRRISKQEYVFYVSVIIEEIHEERMFDGTYPETIKINEIIDNIEKKHGLKELEYWHIGEGPEEYKRLSKVFDAIWDVNFANELITFNAHDIADLWEKSRDEYDQLRERGRRSFHHREEKIAALKDIVIRYEEEAQKAASVKAYSAAVTLLGAGLEGLLLLRCLKSKKRACNIAAKLAKKQRPHYSDDPTKWTFDNLITVCLNAGWLPNISSSLTEHSAAGLADLLRLMRNYVHPGKIARERPWSEICEDDYNDAQAIYVSLLKVIT